VLSIRGIKDELRRSKNMDKTTRYLDEKKVSELTGLALSTLRNWRFLRKGLPYCKVGRSVRYPLEEVYSFMERRRVNVTD
jgi:predicted DNA-binding transcriptional regulator AlpA